METKYLAEYYSMYNEDGRLISKHGNIEFITTMKYIHDYIPKGSRILEVGAGTGRYSVTLAREGYQVTALELLEHNIEVLKSKLTEKDQIIVEQGNALDLSGYQDEVFEAVLILGPMYHLYTEDDKVKVLLEAKRVVKKDGNIFVAYCMNEATMIQFAFKGDGSNVLHCLQNNMLTPDFHCISNPAEVFELVRLEDIDRLNQKSDLHRVKIVAADLFTNYIKDRVDSWSDEVYDIYMKYHFTVCERMDLIGITNHALDILRK